MVDFPMMPQWMFPGAGMMAGMPGVPDMDPATLNAMKWQQGFGMLSDIGAGLARAGMAGKGLGAAGLGVASGLDQNRQRRAQEQEGAFKGMLMQGQLGEMAQKQQQRQALTGWLNTPEGQKALGGMPAAMLSALPPEAQAQLVMSAMKDQRGAAEAADWEERYRRSQGGAAQPQGAGAVGGAPGATDYYTALRGAESGGRNIPNAMGSGAFGPYQFMPATWAGLVQKYGQTHGLTAEGMRDPQQQEKAIRLFTADNRAALKTALGRDPTPDEIYAAHRLGAAGAVKLIQAPPMAQGGALFPTYTAQNPDLNQPAGVIRDQWKARFGNLPVDTMAGGQPPQGGAEPPAGGPGKPATTYRDDPLWQEAAARERAAGAIRDPKERRAEITSARQVMAARVEAVRKEGEARDVWSVDPQASWIQRNARTGEIKGVPGAETEITDMGDGQKYIVNKRTREMFALGPSAKPDKEMTEFQAKSARFADRVKIAMDTLKDVEQEGLSARGTIQASIPGVGNYLQTPAQQQYRRAKEAFLTSLLRDESGAVIGQPEYVRKEMELFPQPGDSPKVVADKRAAREAELASMIRSAGAKYGQPPEGAAGPRVPGAAPRPERPSEPAAGRPQTPADLKKLYGLE